MGQVREVVSAVVRKFFFLSTAKKKVIGREKRLQWRPHLLSLEIGCINKNGYADPDPFWRQKGEVRELQEALECVPSVRGAFERDDVFTWPLAKPASYG